jgi:predicted porin
MGATRLLLNTGNRKTNTNYTSTTNLAGLKTTFSGYGVEYDLSKRTSVIFQNGTEKNTAGTSLGAKTTTSSIGLWHSF